MNDESLSETVLITLVPLGIRHGINPPDGERRYSLVKPVQSAELAAALTAIALGGTVFPVAHEDGKESSSWLLSCGENARILLVEDNAVNRQVARALLKKAGVRADTAENGLEALEALRSNDYDLVLMDLQMPVMDGLAATLAIRAGRGDVRNPDVPVVAMTAHALQSDREACMHAGMNGYITKPIRPAELLCELERRLCAETAPARDNRREYVTRTGPRTFNFDDLVERLGDEETAGLIMEAFLKEMPEAMSALEKSLRTGDFLLSGRNAHTIKGVAGNIGGEALREAALQFERAAKDGDTKLLHALRERVHAEYCALKDEIERMLRTLRPPE
jgi:CheY-like chemotaxis protein